METRRFGRLWQTVALCAVLVLLWLGTAAADTTNSANYRAVDTKFSAGSELDSCSGSYCAKASIGDNTVGRASSANYTAQFGNITGGDPLLEVITEDGQEDLGVLDVNRTATATRVVKVRSYLSKGYIIQLAGNSPSQGTHALRTIATPSTSHKGAEQFGVNLVANSAPAVGADPKHVPSNETSFGYATDDYGTPNLFKYINGDIVARSDVSSGETDYTLTIVVNVSNATPSGHYSAPFSAIVVPLY